VKNRLSRVKYALEVTSIAASSGVFLWFSLLIILRLDIAFFESNGFLAMGQIREDFYHRMFEMDPPATIIFIMALVGVAVVSFVFDLAQVSRVRRLSDAFQDFTKNWEIPTFKELGAFQPHVTYFFEVLAARVRRDSEESIQAALDRSSRSWPTRPRIYWKEQFQFISLGIILTLYFCVAASMFYWRISGKVLDFSRYVPFKTPTGPGFLTAQFEVVSTIAYAVFLIVAVAFIWRSVAFCNHVANFNYAILRDLRSFMSGDLKKRLYLRAGDPALEVIPVINECLDRIAGRLGGQQTASAKTETAAAGST
jgi:hypothetical protein